MALHGHCKENFYLSGIFQHNSSLPLIAENNIYQKILKPKLTFKAAPNHTKDERNEERKIDITNIYSIGRAVEKNTVEGGLSLAYGFDYSLLNKSKNIFWNGPMGIFEKEEFSYGTRKITEAISNLSG